MSYRGGSSPDWEYYIINLKETLEGILQNIKEDDTSGVRADISCLDAFDVLNQYLDGVKRDIGI